MAFNERFADPSASGGGTGTSASDPWTLSEAVANTVAGTRVNFKKGTYTFNSNISFTNAGTNDAPIVWRGYNNTVGDLDEFANMPPVEANMPIFTAGGSYNFDVTGRFKDFYSLCFKGGSSTNYVLQDRRQWSKSVSCIHESMLSGLTTVGVVTINNSSGNKYLNCVYRIAGDTSSSRGLVEGNSQNLFFLNCVFENQTSSASTQYLLNRGRVGLNGCILIGGKYQCRIGDASQIANCIFYNAGDDGVVLYPNSGGGNVQSSLIANNIFHSVSGYAVGSMFVNAAHENSGILFANNAFFNCSNIYENNGDNIQFNDMTLTDDPIVDAANGDFNLNSDTLKAVSYSLNDDTKAYPFSQFMTPVVDTSLPQEAGTQVLPFGQWAVTNPEAQLHPLRSS